MTKLLDQIRDRLKRRLRQFARNRRSRLARYINGLAVDFHRNFENWNYRFNSNGEARVLECLSAGCEIRTIFDAGANQGAWSLMAMEIFPQASIHAFELCPPVAEMLLANVSGKPQIHANPRGLSDENAEIEFFYAPLRNTLSSGIAVTSGTVTRKMPGQVMRGADYCRENHIETIDFLKLDVEGMEEKVLRGFDPLLQRRAIRVIQFEYGRVNIDSHFLLKDFHNLFARYGFVVGKIFPDGVQFREYNYVDEDFLGPNYLAVLSSEDTLIKRLAGEEFTAET